VGKQNFERPGYHVVEKGDWMSKIAKWYGFPKWQTIWDHEKNSKLKADRGDGNLLLVGDKVYIPALEVKPESKATNQICKFKATRQKTSLHLRLLDHKGKPRSGVQYELTFRTDSKDYVFQGTTDGGGQLTHDIPATASMGLLVTDGLSAEHGIVLHIDLDPYDVPSGVHARLENLGYDPGPFTSEKEHSAGMKSALRTLDLREIAKNEKTHTDKLSFDKVTLLRKLHEKK